MTWILERVLPLPGAGRRPLGAAVLICAVLVVGVVGSWHYWILVSSLREGRAELLAARASLAELNLDVDAEELDAADRHAAEAQAALSRADAHFSRDPLIQMAGWLPAFGPQVDAMRELIDSGQLAAEIAHEASAAGEEFVSLRDARRNDEPLATTLMRAVETTEPRVARIEQLTAKLVERRRAIGDAPLIQPLASARDALDEELPALAEAAGSLVQAYDVLPDLLGFQGERRYLVLALNNGELLPGGGLVSAAGVMTVVDGQPGEVDFADSTRWKQEWEAQGGAYIPPPGPLQRYLLRDYTWNLLVSNWDPDFPSWSQQALEFYELVHGPQEVDGVVALDLEVLRRLLAITGPKSLEVEGYGLVAFTTDNAILELERLTRQSFEPSEDRKSVIGDVAQVVLDDVSDLPPERWKTLANTVRELGRSRHIQVIAFDADEQALVRDAGWHGALERGETDFLHFNEASVNSTKLNLIIKPEARYQIDISALGDARHTLSLSYRNDLPEWQQGKDPTLVKQLMLGGVYGAYLRVFAPPSAHSWSVEDEGVSRGMEDSGDGHGLRWFGIFLRLPAGASASPSLRWTVPLATAAPDARLYELVIQKQPGTEGMCMELAITREHEPPAEMTIEGGSRDGSGRLCVSTDVRIRAMWE